MALVPWEFSNVQTISVSELKDKLLTKGCKAVSIVLNTVPKMNKNVEKGVPNPYYGRVTKRAYYGVLIGFNYENSVNNQLFREGKEGDFEAVARAYGEHVEGTPVIEHNGKFYLQCKLQRTISTQFYVDGEPVEESVVEPYIVKSKPSARQAAAGVEKEVKPFNPLLTNIETIVMGGETYTIAKEETTEEATEAVKEVS